MVIIGIDAHKRTHTAVVVDEHGLELARRTSRGTSSADHLELLAWAGRPTTSLLAWLRRTDAHLDALRRDRLWLLVGEATADQGGGTCRPGR